MKVRIEYYFDDEVRRWGFSVWALHIVGSGDTREEARRRAVEAIKFSLEGYEEGFDTGPGVRVDQLDVLVGDDLRKLRVEYRRDDQAQRWGYSVPALGVRGWAEMPDQAKARAIEAANAALRGIDTDFESGDDIEVEHLEVDVRPSSPAMATPAG